MTTLMTFNSLMSTKMEAYIDAAVKAVDSDAFCHGGHLSCAAHVGYDDVDVDQATRVAVIRAAKEAKGEFLRRHPRSR